MPADVRDLNDFSSCGLELRRYPVPAHLCERHFPLLVLLALSGACTVELPIPLKPFRVCLDGNLRFVQPQPDSHGLATPAGLGPLLARIRTQKEHVPLRG